MFDILENGYNSSCDKYLLTIYVETRLCLKSNIMYVLGHCVFGVDWV